MDDRDTYLKNLRGEVVLLINSRVGKPDQTALEIISDMQDILRSIVSEIEEKRKNGQPKAVY